MTLLIDDQATPPLRETIGLLLSRATCADIAVTHVRLAAIDLQPSEVSRLERCRILLGRLDARELSAFGHGTRQRTRLELLLRFVSAPHVEVRSAGLAAWSPDFSIYTSTPHVARPTASAPAGAVAADSCATCLVGAHYFHQPLVDGGPSFTCLLTDPGAIATARTRFEALWQQAHDVRAAVVGEIERVLGEPG